MHNWWRNIVFKFLVVFITITILSVVEFAWHIKDTKALKNTTIALEDSQTSIENLLEADRDAYQAHLATALLIKNSFANKKIHDSLIYAIYQNFGQMNTRFKKFDNNYHYEKSGELQQWCAEFIIMNSKWKTATDSILSLLKADKNYEALSYYKTVYLGYFDPMRHSIDKLTDIHNAESDKYFKEIQEFNHKLNIRSYVFYTILIGIFFMVSFLSLKSIIKRTWEINRLNLELSKMNEELKTSNINLGNTNEELEATNEELLTSNEALNDLNNSLEIQKMQLEDALSNLKKTQLQLIQSEKKAALGIIVSGFAHEINNPINFITSGISALECSIQDILNLLKSIQSCKNLDDLLTIKDSQKKIEESAKIIEKLFGGLTEGAKRTAEIVQKVRLHHQDQELDELTNINKLVELCLFIDNTYHGKEITYIKKLGNVLDIYCNGKNLCQAINIIVKNGIDAIEKSGEITLATGSTDEEVYISITDTGCGIPNNIIDKIFDPFFTTKPVGKGTGLGLYIAYDLVKKGGGQIVVDTELHKGSTFTIFLPKNKDKQIAAKIISNNYRF